jgi:hypothetical protein
MTDQPQEPSKPQEPNRAASGCLILILILVIPGAIALIRSNDEPADSPNTTTQPQTTAAPATAEPQPADNEPDASAKAACEHFRNIMSDVANGILTDAELREKFRGVHRSASISDEPGLAQAGTKLLASMTTGTTQDLLKAAGQFDRECDQAGL